MKGYYTVRDVCGLFKVARETIRRWEKARCFPRRVALSGHERGRKGFPIEEVEAWDLERRRARTDDPHDEPGL